jgi:hypothetical protein
MLTFVNTVNEMSDLDVGVPGPAVRKLTEKQRAFVWAYGMTPGITAQRAAQIAGYGNPDSDADNDHVLRQSGHRLLTDQKIIEAIKEVAGRKIVGEALGAAEFLSGVYRDPKAPLALRVRSAESLLDRGGLAGLQNINVNHHHTDETGATMVERIRALAARLGVDEAKLLGGNAVASPALIDVTPGKPE